MTSSPTIKPNWLQALDMLEPQPVQQMEYRLYHDDQGQPLFYSMQDLPGRYITVDANTYAQGRYDIRVINGQIKLPTRSRPGKIKPADSGVACHPTNAMIIKSDSTCYWKLQNYED